MHWVHFVLLRGVAKRARVNPFTIYCCRSLLQLPLMLQMWLPTCAIHSVWCFFFRWIKVLSLRTSYLWTMMNWTHISSTQLSSRYRNARAMPSTGRSSCCRTTQKKRRGGFFNEEKLLWLTLLLLNRCLLHTYLLHGLPFFFKLLLLLLLLLTTLMNSIAFVVFRLHTIFFFFLAFFCQTAPADVWWRVVVRWLSNRQKAQYFDGEKWANCNTLFTTHRNPDRQLSRMMNNCDRMNKRKAKHSHFYLVGEYYLFPTPYPETLVLNYYSIESTLDFWGALDSFISQQ